MRRSLVLALLVLGCSNDPEAAPQATDAAAIADASADTSRDVEGFGVDSGAGCGHDLCLNFDDGKLTPLGTSPNTGGGGMVSLDADARSKPGCMLATSPAPVDGTALARISVEVSPEGSNARLKLAMRLDPIAFDATHIGFVHLVGMHLDNVRRDVTISLDRDGLFLTGRYAVASDGGVSSVELPRKTFMTKPAPGVWTDVELTMTEVGDGARVVATIGGESITADMAASLSDPVRSARFEFGIQAVRPFPAVAVRFDDVAIDVGN